MPVVTEVPENEAKIIKRMSIAIYECPACGHKTTDNDIELANTRSHEDASYLCPQCRTDEPLLNFIRDWPPVTDVEHTLLEVILMTAEDRIAGGRHDGARTSNPAI